MEKLKTLNDIEIPFPPIKKNLSYQEGYIEGSLQTGKKIKVEAIKEHLLLNDHYKSNKIFPFMFSWDKERKQLQAYIKWKNNLTEEDLK